MLGVVCFGGWALGGQTGWVTYLVVEPGGYGLLRICMYLDTMVLVLVW